MTTPEAPNEDAVYMLILAFAPPLKFSSKVDFHAQWQEQVSARLGRKEPEWHSPYTFTDENGVVVASVVPGSLVAVVSGIADEERATAGRSRG